MQERRSSSFCVDWMDAKGKKDIIDNMHEHKVYQQILEQQHLKIIISLKFLAMILESSRYFLARLRSQRVLGIWGRSKISSQVPCLIIVPQFKEWFFRCHCHVEVSKCIKNLGVKTKSGHRFETQLFYLSWKKSSSGVLVRRPCLQCNCNNKLVLSARAHSWEAVWNVM